MFLLRILSAACLAIGLCAVSAKGGAPSCHNTSRPMQIVYACSGFTSSNDFAEHVERPLLHPYLTLVLSDSHLELFPPQAFADVNATILELSNVTMKYFNASSLVGFGELRNSLEKLVLKDNTTLPETWGALKSLQNLKIIRLSQVRDVKLTRDFNELSQSLVAVEVVHSSILQVDDDWLAEISNLESLVIRDCNLKVFLRSMLPRPAAKLWNLDLVMNNITSLPADFGHDLPALRFLDLQSNYITTVDEESLAPLNTNTTDAIELGGNPLDCDCKVRHLRDFPTRLLSAKCDTPEDLKRRPVQELADEDLQCDANS